MITADQIGLVFGPGLLLIALMGADIFDALAGLVIASAYTILVRACRRLFRLFCPGDDAEYRPLTEHAALRTLKKCCGHGVRNPVDTL